MLRLRAALLLAGLAIGVHHRPAATQDRWLQIAGAEGQVRVLADTTRLERTRSGVKLWVRYDFLQPIMNNNLEIDRAVFLQEYDCATMQTRPFSVTRYLRGVVVEAYTWPAGGGGWLDNAPDTIGERAILNACALFASRPVSRHDANQGGRKT
jgi:hypothetical protein